MLYAEMSTVLLCPLHGTLEYATRLLKFKLIDRRKDVLVLEVRLCWALFSHVIFNFSVDSSFRLIIYPFSDEKFVFIVVEIRTLTFT
jgi:hypothetical protein